MFSMALNDKKIISELRNDSRISLTKMSRNTGIPVSTIFNRIQNNEYVEKNTCLINFEKVGYNTWAKVIIKAERSSKEEFKKFLTVSSNVNSIFRINQGYDFLIELIFKNMYELEEYLDMIKDRFQIKECLVYFILEDIES